MNLPRAGAAVLVVACAAQLSSAVAAQTPPSTTPPRQGCERRDPWGQCLVEIPVPVEVTSPDGDPSEEDTGGPGGPLVRPVCPWVTVPAGPSTEETLRRLFPDAPADAVLQVRDCADSDPANPGGTQFGLSARWVPGGPSSPASPSPTAVALILYARVQALMEAPALAMNPPVGAPALTRMPVFVEVTNWGGEITDSQCVLDVCVEMTATPALDFDPGEPQAHVIRCDPPGSRFDAALGSAEAQAATPGSCAYAYQQRTGVEGRPQVWPGEVTVRWSVSWTSNVGVAGSFPELALSTGAPRVVDEVQTVVADRG